MIASASADRWLSLVVAESCRSLEALGSNLRHNGKCKRQVLTWDGDPSSNRIPASGVGPCCVLGKGDIDLYRGSSARSGFEF